MKKSIEDATPDELAIVEIFNQNVRGKTVNSSKSNPRHDGKDGHWLEKQMNIVHNADNKPDLLGFEMKNTTRSKTTFGDWSADYYIFKKSELNLTRSEFIKTFGKPNPKKDNRYSWSGDPIPKVNKNSPYNNSRLVIEEDTNDISIVYDFSTDPRPNKSSVVPQNLQIDNLILAKWLGSSLEDKLVKKFGQCGWFRCSRNDEGVYDRIEFGKPITFEDWMDCVKEGIVFFDSGMCEGNPRNYSQWRAYNKEYWCPLILRTY